MARGATRARHPAAQHRAAQGPRAAPHRHRPDHPDVDHPDRGPVPPRPGLDRHRPWRFQAALETARTAGDDQARLAALRRPPPATGARSPTAPATTGPSRTRAARRRALDAWARIAEILQPADPEQALAALEAALTHDPYNEYPYQQIMRLQAAAAAPTPSGVPSPPGSPARRAGGHAGRQTRQLAAALLGTGEPPGSGSSPPAQPRSTSPAPACSPQRATRDQPAEGTRQRAHAVMVLASGAGSGLRCCLQRPAPRKTAGTESPEAGTRRAEAG